LAEILFYLLALGAIGFGVGVVMARMPLFSVLCLLGSFFCLSGIYLLAGFQFLAATQLLVYAGAIMVLFLFVIMLLNLGGGMMGGDAQPVLKVLGGALLGAVTFKLAGILSARASGGAAAGASAAAAPARTQAQLEQARQECLQEKIAAAQEAQKKKRGFGRLMSGIGRVANRFGGDFGQEMAEVSRDVYDVNATAADLSQAAKDLGVTEDEIESCRNP